MHLSFTEGSGNTFRPCVFERLLACMLEMCIELQEANLVIGSRFSLCLNTCAAIICAASLSRLLLLAVLCQVWALACLFPWMGKAQACCVYLLDCFMLETDVPFCFFFSWQGDPKIFDAQRGESSECTSSSFHDAFLRTALHLREQ